MRPGKKAEADGAPYYRRTAKDEKGREECTTTLGHLHRAERCIQAARKCTGETDTGKEARTPGGSKAGTVLKVERDTAWTETVLDCLEMSEGSMRTPKSLPESVAVVDTCMGAPWADSSRVCFERPLLHPLEFDAGTRGGTDKLP